MKSNKFFLSCIFILLPVMGLTQEPYKSPTELFQEANQFLEKGDYVQSLEIYQSLLSQGFESASLYYNLGNLYFRRGERGRSILWYERATLLSPRDADIQFNLAIARSHLRDEQKSSLRQWILYFTENELSVIVLLLTWLFFLVLGARWMGWLKSETWPPLYLWLSGSLVLLFGAWLGFNAHWRSSPLGIVVAPPGEVRNGPGTEYAVGFTIPEGSSVVIMNKRPDWVQVGVPQQGLKGWMPAKDVEMIPATSVSLG